MAKKYKNPRISFVPSSRVLAALNELAELSGKTKASIVSGLLEEAATVIEGQLGAFRQIAAAPERAREVLQDYANKAVSDIAQAVIDFDAPPPKRPRGRPRGSGAAKTG